MTRRAVLLGFIVCALAASASAALLMAIEVTGHPLAEASVVTLAAAAVVWPPLAAWQFISAIWWQRVAHHAADLLVVTREQKPAE